MILKFQSRNKRKGEVKTENEWLYALLNDIETVEYLYELGTV